MREAGAAFALALTAFAAGAAPSATFGDAGELAAASAVLGVAHAPGYPLHALAARAFGALVPLGDWAHRCALLSAVCAAAALALLLPALRALGCGRAARWSAVAAVGAAPLWRLSAGVTEVFGIHLLLAAAVLAVVAAWGEELCAPRPAALLGLLFGLASGNHHTLALAGPVVLWRAALGKPSPRTAARGAAHFALLLAMGFAINAYLPIRARADPPLDWGHAVDLPRFARALLRKDYGTFALTTDGRADAGLAAQGARWLSAAGAQLGWPLVLLAFAGLGAAALPSGARAAAGAWALLLGPAFLWLGNPPFDAQTSGALERFYLASWLGAALLAAGAVETLRRRRRELGWAAAAALLLGGARGWTAPAVRGDFAAYDYGRSLQASLPPGAALFMDGGDDTFYSLAYLAYARGRRPDLELRDRGGLVFASAYGADFRSVPAQFKEPVREAVEERYARDGRLFYSTLNERLLPRYELRPWGLLRRPSPKGAPREPHDLFALYPARFERALLAARYRDRALAAFYPYQRAVDLADRGDLAGAQAQLALALDWAPDAAWLPPDAGYQAGTLGFRAVQARDWALARRFYELWRRCAPEQAEPLLNLGVVAEKSGQPFEAERLYLAASALEPHSPRPPYNLGALYWGQKRWADAAAQLERAHRLKPDDAAIARFAAEAARRSSWPR